MEVVEFNSQEPPEQVIGRLCREANADAVIPVDCAGANTNLMVRGYFVVPDKAIWSWVAPEPSSGA